MLQMFHILCSKQIVSSAFMSPSSPNSLLTMMFLSASDTASSVSLCMNFILLQMMEAEYMS